MLIVHHMTARFVYSRSLFSVLSVYLHPSFRQLNHTTSFPCNVPGTCHVHRLSYDLYGLIIYFFSIVPSTYLHWLFRQLDHFLLSVSSRNSYGTCGFIFVPPYQHDMGLTIQTYLLSHMQSCHDLFRLQGSLSRQAGNDNKSGRKKKKKKGKKKTKNKKKKKNKKKNPSNDINEQSSTPPSTPPSIQVHHPSQPTIQVNNPHQSSSQFDPHIR
jgi:hypothetical protein